MRRLKPLESMSASSTAATVQAWVLPYLIQWVHEQGADASAIRSLPGLSDVSDPDRRVSETSVEAAWRLAAAVTHTPAIGLHLAQWLPRGALDLVEYAFRSSATLVAGLERLSRYGAVVSDRAAIQLERTDDRVRLQVRDVGRTSLHHGRTEFALAVTLRLARDATGCDITPQQVCFAHSRPAHSSVYERFFRTPVLFDAGSDVMVLSPADAALPLRGADEALSAVVRRRLEKALVERRHAEGARLGDRVKRLMLEHLGRATLTPGRVARTLAVSPRTLSRRLEAEDTSFRQLLDDVRCESACALLQDPSVRIGDIAFFLQYSEAAAFHRAFRRWTGQAPREFRAACLAGQHSAAGDR